MVKWESKKLGDLLMLGNGLVLIVLINLLAANNFFRLDLTEEKRYTIKEPTREMLDQLDDDVYVEVFLEGELNAEFRRFRKAVEETLEEFRIYSGNKLHYTFLDPATAMGQRAQNDFIQELGQKGIQATNVIDRTEAGTETKLIFPGALVYYGGAETGVMLLKANQAASPEEKINQSIEGVEYELANAIYKLANTDRKRLGFLTGHGELDSLDIAAFNNALLEHYFVNKVDLANNRPLDVYDALIIAKPRRAFSETDKYRLDQYIMQGGKVLFLLDKMEADMDSASREGYLALPVDINLDDQLFKYGVRINYDLVQDRNAGLYPIVTGETNSKPEIQLLEWPFFPLINHYAEHPVTRNVDAVVTRFVSSVDTVKAEGVTKTPLMMTSRFARVVGAPVNISVQAFFREYNPDALSSGNIPVGYLLEGTFTSVFKNRFLPEGVATENFKEESVPTKLVVLADGDIARNEINPRSGQPQALGFDPMSNYTFANRDLLMNILAYFTEENGLITARTKEVKIRPLDREKLQTEKVRWQVINLVLPLVVIVLYGVLRAFMRKRKYARFGKSNG